MGLPDYFESAFADSQFDKETGIISGRTKSCEYSFKIQFRDGRIRIDPPKMIMISDGQKKTLSEYINVSSLLFKGTEPQRRTIVIQNANSVINELLAYAETVEEDWSDPQIIEERDKRYFSLGTNWKFEFQDGKDCMVYSMPECSKDYILSFYKKFARSIGTSTKKFYDYLQVRSDFQKSGIAFAKEPRGLIINGYQDIQISGLLGLYVTFRFFYQGYIGCQDGMVKVYVPKVTKVESTSDNPTKYKSFERFLKSWRICNDDGSPRVDKDGLVAKDIDRMEQTFNLILFAPLYYMLQARQRPLKVDEEEW